jgi:sarcosine oxidase/L-pipecolate oxidase
MYMKLAAKALESWTKDPLYSQHFHNAGLLYAYDTAYLTKIMANWEVLCGNGKAPSSLLDPAEAKSQFGGVFQDADWTMATQSLWSPTAGWTDSAAVLQSVNQAAVELGAHFVDSGAAKLLFDDKGSCIGAKTLDGRTVLADRTILAAGAFIPFLLAESAPDKPEIHAGHRLIATAAPMCLSRVPDEETHKFRDCPVMALRAKLDGLAPSTPIYSCLSLSSVSSG